MNITSVSRAVTAPQKCRVTLAAALVSLLASHPAHALPTSFPQYPLQTGFTSIVPANVMLILDDSGSMDWDSMPVNTSGYQDNRRSGPWPELRSYASNVIYYNPANEYRPWRKATMPGDPDERMPNASINSVSRNSTNLNNANYDLRGTADAFFFIPRVPNPKLWRAVNNRAPALGGLPKSEYDLYRISKQGIVQRCKRLGSDCTLSSPDSDWEAKLPANNNGRNNDQEVQNYANWYHYHRSRMKMAKAGASEAFGQLGRNVRVGYDRINSDKIVSPIPSGDGLFEGTNRQNFFNTLQAQGARGGTPLRNALIRTGEYYKTDAPYKNGAGDMLSCRKNFAVLTTDGEWNGENPSNRNLQTLAAIGNHYWKTDLRSNLVNNVPKSTNDEANWQHMNTFGISIGLGGNLSSAPAPTGGPWPNPGPNKGALNIDDLARAAGEGRGRFFLANNTDEFAKALADALKDTAARDVSAANATSSGNQINNDLKNIGTSFHSGDWHGDVIVSDKKLKPVWKLSETFAGGINANFSSRTVLTSYGGTAKLFDKSTITDAVFGRSDHPAVSVADNIDYLRGVQSLEEGKGGSLRKRHHPIGDIVNASPFYALDTNTLFVGANDGMLHAIDAESIIGTDPNNPLEGINGKVLFSYVPKGINAEEMASLSSTKYEHRFLVDGNIDVSTSQITSGKNILIAALGRGGRGVFALDVTDPKAMGISQVLWDNTTQDATTDKNMGYVLGRLRIRPGNGGKTWALVPNGIESPDGKAVLFAYELDTDGKIAQTHELVANNDTDNGLMSLGMADINGDGAIDIVYGGDLKGNLWRWDFSTDTPGPATLLFTAVNDNGQPQPITGGITNARDPVTDQIFVGFGTGRLISKDDLPIEGGPALQPIQSLYGFIDPIGTISIDNQALIKRSDLQERSIPYTGKQNNKNVRAFEQYLSLDVGKKGWYINLPANERVISDASMAGGEAMVVASIFPPDPTDVPGCESAAGNGFLNAVNLFTGTSPIFKPGGGYFTGTAYPPVKLPNSGVEVTIGSIGINEGMPSAPNVVCDNDSCKVIVDKGDGHIISEEGPKLDGAAVEPHRLQWRSLR